MAMCFLTAETTSHRSQSGRIVINNSLEHNYLKINYAMLQQHNK